MIVSTMYATCAYCFLQGKQPVMSVLTLYETCVHWFFLQCKQPVMVVLTMYSACADCFYSVCSL